MDEVSEQTDKKEKNKSTDRDDIHSGVLKKLGDETAETWLHVSKISLGKLEQFFWRIYILGGEVENIC